MLGNLKKREKKWSANFFQVTFLHQNVIQQHWLKIAKK